MLDWDAYAQRIGVSPRPGIAQLHRAHVTSIPFENLDPLRGVAVSLEPADLERKLVAQRRGGYCFEQNLLLKAALEHVGARVELMLARVRLGAPAGVIRPRSHLVLAVHTEAASWHADVGFGHGTLLEPIPFGSDEIHEQSGWRFRVVPDGPELVLQAAAGAGWTDLYGLIPQPVPMVDLITSNWFTCTHPHSPFRTGLIVGAVSPDGTRLMLSDRDSLTLTLTEQTPGATTVTPVAREALPQLLEQRFGLAGFMLDGDGRIARPGTAEERLATR